MNKILRNLLISLASSVLIVGLMLQLVSHVGAQVSAADIVTGIRNAALPLVGVYIACQFAQTFFRAWRARVLLASSVTRGRVPSVWHISLVTFVRGACADMLPARIGELSYVAMLNRGYSIPAGDCFSSLTIGLLFDFLALLVVLVTAIATAANGATLIGSTLVLALVCAVGIAGLFYMLPWFAKRLQTKSPEALMKIKMYSQAVDLAGAVAESVTTVRRSGVFFNVLGISALIRAAKYIGLYFLFVGVTRNAWPALANADVATTLIGLISAEGAASLPVPTFMSFGSYEAGGVAAFVAMGYSAGAIMAAMFAVHIVSQIVDYGMGGIAFLIFTWLPKHSPAAEPRNKISRKSLFTLAVAGCVLLGVLAFAALEYRAVKKRGRLVPPEVGAAVALSTADIAALENLSGEFRGRVVWSSNRRNGRHDIFMATFPGGEVEQLTRSEFTDTFPRFSPDGKHIAFSRSQQPWVSQRNPLLWDTWVLDLETRKEILVATNAFMSVWADNGDALVFTPDGGATVVKQKAEPDAERKVLIRNNSWHISEKERMTLPVVRDGDPWMTATIRGSRRFVAVFYGDDVVTKIGNDGCQGVWMGTNSATLVWIDNPGKMKNAIYISKNYDDMNVLLDVPGEYSHEYFPAFSQSGKWLVFGASTGGHEQDTKDYEIFLWRVGAPQDSATRVTFHTGNDCWPDVRED